jgi:hypothetical protein
MRNATTFLFWLPRILAGLYAAFLAMFALDAFSEQRGLSMAVLAFAIHLIPAAVVLILLALAWRWELPGGLLFAAVGLAYAVRMDFRLARFIVISGPAFALAVLFLYDWCRGIRV